MSRDLLTAGQIIAAKLGIAVWCEAQRRAGFSDNDRVVVSREAYAPKGQKDQFSDEEIGSAPTLGAPSAVFEAFIRALDGSNSWDGGARLAVLSDDQRYGTAFLNAEDFTMEDGAELDEWPEWKQPSEWQTANRLIAGLGGACTDPEEFLLPEDQRTCWQMRFGFLTTPMWSQDGSHPALVQDVISCLTSHMYKLVYWTSTNAVIALGALARGSTIGGVLSATTIDSARLHLAARKLPICGGNVDLVLKQPGVSGATGASFIVPGYVPRGSITLIAGAASTGKSTLLHDLALLVGTPVEGRGRGRTWLGVPAERIAHGRTVFLSGEDSEDILYQRGMQLLSDCSAQPLIVECPSDGRDLEGVLESLFSVDNIVLLVIDPARKFIKGSEDESANVDEFLTKLTRFSADKRCAVAVVHHLRRNARPSDPGQVLDAIRGSQVFIDRARCVIGMAFSRQSVGLKVVKSNFPPSCNMQTETVRFARDEATLRLVAINDVREDAVKQLTETGKIDDDVPVQKVVEAITVATARGLRITRTGQSGVFERGLPGLAGMSRLDVRGAVDRALLALKLRLDGKRLLPHDDEPDALPQLPVNEIADLAIPATEAESSENQDLGVAA